MRIDRAGLPFIAAALAPAAFLFAVRRYALATPFAVLGGFMAYFFRDPERHVPQDPDAVVSPADGRVMIAGPSDGRWSPPGSWKQVTIFLSPLDVHINRSPVSGIVTDVSYKKGSFAKAWSHDAANNERSEIWIDHGGVPIVFRQVVGAMARRVVCRLTIG